MQVPHKLFKVEHDVQNVLSSLKKYLSIHIKQETELKHILQFGIKLLQSTH